MLVKQFRQNYLNKLKGLFRSGVREKVRLEDQSWNKQENLIGKIRIILQFLFYSGTAIAVLMLLYYLKTILGINIFQGFHFNQLWH